MSAEQDRKREDEHARRAAKFDTESLQEGLDEAAKRQHAAREAIEGEIVREHAGRSPEWLKEHQARERDER